MRHFAQTPRVESSHRSDYSSPQSWPASALRNSVFPREPPAGFRRRHKGDRPPPPTPWHAAHRCLSSSPNGSHSHPWVHHILIEVVITRTLKEQYDDLRGVCSGMLVQDVVLKTVALEGPVMTANCSALAIPVKGAMLLPPSGRGNRVSVAYSATIRMSASHLVCRAATLGTGRGSLSLGWHPPFSVRSSV